MTETNKITLLRSGDRTYLRSLYTDVLPAVVLWITRNNGVQADAHDVFQDALEALIHKAYQAENHDDLRVEGMLVQIAKNKWIDKLRRKKYDDKVRSIEVDRYDSEYSTEPDIIAAEEAKAKQDLLSATLAKLSDKCQQLLKMIMAEHATEEIVKSLGMSNANTMYRRKHACMKTWKSYIDDAGYEQL